MIIPLLLASILLVDVTRISVDLLPILEGVQKTRGSAKPIAVRLGVPPTTLKSKLPGAAKYGTLRFDGASYTVAVSLGEPAQWAIYLDLDRDNAFSPAEKLKTAVSRSQVLGADGKPVEMVTAIAMTTIVRKQDGQEISYPVILGVADPTSKDTLLVVRDYARKGKVKLGAGEYELLLDDTAVQGRFSYDGKSETELELYIDFDGDGFLNPSSETVPLGKVFSVDGVVYRVVEVNQSGTRIVFVPEEVPSYWGTGKGAKIFSFVAPLADGGVFRFPEDAKGKKVLFLSWVRERPDSQQVLHLLASQIERLTEKGVLVVGVNLEVGVEKERIRKAGSFHLPGAPHIYEALGEKGAVARRLGLFAAPLAMLVDGDTRTVLMPTVEAAWNKIHEWLPRILELPESHHGD